LVLEVTSTVTERPAVVVTTSVEDVLLATVPATRTALPPWPLRPPGEIGPARVDDVGRGGIAGAGLLEPAPHANATDETPTRRRSTAGAMTNTRDQKVFIPHLSTECWQATPLTPLIGDEHASVA
jgi:hypothetical protein